MSFYKIRPRSGTKAQWETANTILAEREIGYELPDGGVGTGVVKMKMGDGVTAWNDLPYAIPIYLSPDDIVQDATTDSSVKVPSASVTKNLQDQVTALNNSLKLKTISVNNVNYANGTSYYKYDGIGNKKVKVEAFINQTLPANAEYPINNIPSNLKPDVDIQFVVIIM